MSSPESAGNPFTTPNSSPELTEANLRALENSLDHFRQSLDETVQNFNVHFDNFTQVDDCVFEQIQRVQAPPIQVSENQLQPIPLQRHLLNQVSTETVSVENLIRKFESAPDSHYTETKYFTSGLPLFRARRSLSRSLPRSVSSQGRLSSYSMPGSLNGGDLDTQNSAIMSGTEQEAENEPATNGGSSEWKRFERFARGQMTIAKNYVTKIRSKLANQGKPCIKVELNAHNTVVHRWHSKLADIEHDLKCLTIADDVPGNLSYELGADVEDLIAELNFTAATIEDMLSNLKENSNSNKYLIENLKAIKDNLQSAHAPSLELPTYEGDTIKFIPFKTTFHRTLLALNIPKELWASHLVACLKGPAKDYIGAGEQWFNRYEELWQNLEDKYANSWNLNYTTISKFFTKTLTSEDPEQVNAFINDQILNLENVKLLKLTPENIGIIYMMHQLPVASRDIMRNAMKLRKPNSKITDFTVEEFRQIFNETIGTIIEENKDVSTFSFKNQASMAKQQTYRDPPSSHNEPKVTYPARRQSPEHRDYHYQHHASERREDYEASRYERSYYSRPDAHDVSRNSYQGQYSYRESRSPARGYYRSTSRERCGNVRSPSRTYHRSPSRERHRNSRSPDRDYSRNTSQQVRHDEPTVWCSLCVDDSSSHPTHSCPYFTTISAKRNRLISIDRCPDCTRLNQNHPNSSCPSHLSCQFHPGERHYTWLCSRLAMNDS